MKGKNLLLLLVLVGALGYAGWLTFQDNRDSWSQKGAGGAGAKVVEFPVNDVALVRIKTASGEVNLTKGDEWTVKERADYPAGFEQVSDLLRKWMDLKTVQEVKVGPSQMARMELVEPGQGDGAGTLLEFKDKEGKSLAAVLLGKKQLRKSEGGGMGGMGDDGGMPMGRYVMPVGAKSRVSLVSQTFDEIEAKPERWLRKDFIKIENPKSVTLAGATDAQKWKLTRESATAEWKLADVKAEESLDTGKISPLTSAFSNANFKDVLAPDAKPADTGLDKPSVMTIETTDNFTYKLEIGKLADEAYPVRVTVSANLVKERTPGKDEKPEDKTKLDDEFKASLKKLEDKLAAEKKFETRAYVIERFTIDALLKDRSALLAEKKPEPAPTPATPAPGSPGAAAPMSPATPAPAHAPVTVTTPPVSIPSAPVAVPAEAAKPMVPPPEAAPKPAPDAPPAPAPEAAPAPKAPPAKPSVSATTPPISVTTAPVAVPPAVAPADAAKPAPAAAPPAPAPVPPPPAPEPPAKPEPKPEPPSAN